MMFWAARELKIKDYFLRIYAFYAFYACVFVYTELKLNVPHTADSHCPSTQSKKFKIDWKKI